MTNEPSLRSRQSIRRFDEFAETKRLEALSHREPEDLAKGYESELQKFVASK